MSAATSSTLTSQDIWQAYHDSVKHLELLAGGKDNVHSIAYQIVQISLKTNALIEVPKESVFYEQVKREFAQFTEGRLAFHETALAANIKGREMIDSLSKIIVNKSLPTKEKELLTMWVEKVENQLQYLEQALTLAFEVEEKT